MLIDFLGFHSQNHIMADYFFFFFVISYSLNPGLCTATHGGRLVQVSGWRLKELQKEECKITGLISRILQEKWITKNMLVIRGSVNSNSWMANCFLSWHNLNPSKFVNWAKMVAVVSYTSKLIPVLLFDFWNNQSKM